MRIISGSAGGIPILVPKTVLRPTSDRVREAVFSILGPRVTSATVLDLCAGSGAYGLECLSRGAASATFVEMERAAAEVIRQNLAKAKLPNGTVICHKVESFLKSPTTQKFDLIFADPPYKKSPNDQDLAAILTARSEVPELLSAEGIFILECFAKNAPNLAESPLWQTLDQRRYGDSSILLLTPRR